MSFGFIGSILAAIVGVATIYVLVSNQNTSSIISAGGTAFSSGLKAAMGK